jgi:transcriptional regulator with XRE-family HTH domain
MLVKCAIFASFLAPSTVDCTLMAVRDRNQGMARALRVARAARGHDRAKVERDAEIGRGSLSEYETGQRDPDGPTVRRMAVALGVSETTLVTLSLRREEREKIGEQGVDALAAQIFRELLQ